MKKSGKITRELSKYFIRRPEYVMDNERILELVTRERNNLISMGYTTITLGDMNAKIGGLGCLKEKGNDLRVNQNGHLLK